MRARPVIDAGPALNFLAINQERWLINILDPISAPETVENEVLRKSRTDHRFQRVGLVWSKLTPRWIEILSDDWTPGLEAVCNRLTQTPWSERQKQAKDLGEPHAKLREYDDGLLPISETSLLSSELWQVRQR